MPNINILRKAEQKKREEDIRQEKARIMDIHLMQTIIDRQEEIIAKQDETVKSLSKLSEDNFTLYTKAVAALLAFNKWSSTLSDPSMFKEVHSILQHFISSKYNE